jgi:hypothetical protein
MKSRRVAVAALVVLAACTDRTPLAPLNRPLNGLSSSADIAQLSASGGSIFYSGRFVRATGAPNEYSRTIDASDLDAPFVIHIRDGDGKKSRVSSAKVALDGRVLLAEDDFSKNATGWDLPVGVGAFASLDVRVAGSPGSFIDISLEGHRRTFHVCPGAEIGNGHYATITAAVADAPAGGTIRLCDGVHSAESVIVDRALTFQPEAGASPVVRNIATAGALVLSGPATGTVAIHGIGFQNNAPFLDNGNRALGSYSVRSSGSALDLVISSSSFTSIAVSNGGVYVGNSALPTTALTVDRSFFTGGLFGVFTDLAGAVTVRGSTFTNLGLFGTRTGAATSVVTGNTADHCTGTCFVAVRATGVNSDNVATFCGSTACASASGGNATIVNNRYSNHGANAVIYFFGPTGPGSGGSGRIENNEIDGCAANCILAKDGTTVDVINNRITAYFGDATRLAITGTDGEFFNGLVPGATMNIRGNIIVGIGGHGATAPNDPLSYPFSLAAVLVEGHSSGTVINNHVTNAAVGILTANASNVTGSGNTIDLTHVAIQIVGAGAQAALHGNDLTRYVQSILESGNNTSSLTCNWWGTASGAPVASSFTTTQGTALFTPFAATPIVATGATTCAP